MGMGNHTFVQDSFCSSGEGRPWGVERTTWRCGFTCQNGACLRWKQIGSIPDHAYTCTHTKACSHPLTTHIHTHVCRRTMHTSTSYTNTHMHKHTRHTLTGVHNHIHIVHTCTYILHGYSYTHTHTYVPHTHTHILMLNIQHTAHSYAYTHVC